MKNSAKNILIVDDNAALRRLFAESIQTGGYLTSEASDGAEALNLLEKIKVDAIISDILMPGMDGYRLCYEVRKNPKHSALPFIFLTGAYTSADDEQHALDLGADRVFRKPLSSNKVLDALREMFSDPLYKIPRATKPIQEVEMIKQYTDSLVIKLEEKITELREQSIEFNKLSIAFEYISDSIVISNKQGVIEYVNPAFERNTGFTKEFAIGKTPAILKSGKHDAAFYAKLWHTILSGKTFKEEFINRKSDGELYYEQQAISPVFDTEGNIVHFVCAGRDVTRRRKVDEELRLAHAQLEELVERSPAVIFKVKIETGRVHPYVVSTNVTRLLGFTVEEVKSFEWWSTHVYPDDREKMLSSIEETLRRGALHCEYRLRHKNGEYIWVEDNRRVVRDPAGRSEEIVGVWVDISERKRTEEQLKLLAHTVSSARDYISIADLEDNLIFVNTSFCEAYGYSEEELLGKKVSLLRAASVEPKQAEQIFRETLLGSWNGEVMNRRKDGSEFLIELWTSGVKDSSGRAVATVGISRDITERKRVEDALRESEEQYRLLVQTLPDGVIVHSHGLVAFANPASATIIGAASPADLIGKPVIEFVHPDYREMALERIQHSLSESVPVPLAEEKFVRLDGTLIDVEVSAVPFFYAGTPAMLTVFNDITKRKLAEAELQMSEVRHRAILESATDAIVSADEKGTIISWNRGAEQMFGYSYSEIVGQSLTTLVPQRYRERHTTALNGVLSGGKLQTVGHTVEMEGLCKDGSEFPIELSLSMWEVEGQMFFTGIIRDIAERKSSVGSLLKSEKKYRTLFEESTDGLFISTVSGKVVDVNSALVTMHGYASKEEMLNLDATKDIYANETDRKTMLGLLKLKGTVQNFETVEKKKDGSTITVLLTVTAERDAEGNIVSIRGLTRDVTKQRQLEQQFLRAQRMENIGTLAGGIAHDLNNVLSPIMMGIGMLKQSVEDEGGQKILRTLEASAQRGSDMVKQVLGFARGMSGDHIVLMLGHLIREMRTIVRETFPKSIHCRTDVAKNLWSISADATQMHQVLLNFCVNARDAMPDGGTLTIAAENLMIDEGYALMNIQAKPGPYIVLTVTDTGTGIAPKILEKVFDPFFTTKEIGKGTGLGLSTVHSIVKSHGGYITVYSEVGKGTKFRVYLPAVTSTEEKKSSEVSTELPVGHGELILVVDDEASIREICRTTLESFGYNVLVAADGTEAVVQYANNTKEIQLVLTDMMMPFMDGRATIRALSKINPDVRIIATSGLLTEQKSLDESDLSVCAFLAKPYTTSTLLIAVAKALSNDDKAGSGAT